MVNSTVEYITNDGLKEFIKEVQFIFKEQLEDTKVLRTERNYEPILETQYEIREYLVKHQRRIQFSKQGFMLKDKACLSMPSLFGLYLMVLSDVDKVFCVNDAMKQIEKRYFRHMGEEMEAGMDVEEAVFSGNDFSQINKRCCCSHSCKLVNMGIIRNSFTNYYAIIGCDCIFKHKLIDRDVYNEEKKKTRKEMIKKREKERIKQNLIEEKRRREEEIRINEEIEAERVREEERVRRQEYEDEKERLKKIKDDEKKRRDRQKSDEPIYLVVSYDNSSIDEVKRLGCKWDCKKGPYGLWYIPPNWVYTSEILDKYKIFVIKKRD
jgi:hypothetical protein